MTMSMLYLLWSPLLLLLLLKSVAPASTALSTNHKKIAFLFLTRGEMPLEDVWREFFHWRTDPSEYSIYIHPRIGFNYPETSFFYKRETAKREIAKWGGMSQVKAIKDLVRQGLEDPDNEWFVLMSEACIPLHSFPTWKAGLFSQNKSVTNACWMDPRNMELDSRWRPTLADVGMKKEYWRKSATWFALKRSHAQVFADEVTMEDAFDPVPCVDEHYLPIILAYNHLDNETTCSDGFIHHYFASPAAAHPVQYSGDAINADLFKRLARPVGEHNEVGFGLQCSGIPNICHFTARKFSPMSKYSILEHMNLILDEEGYPYTGDPFTHIRTLFRKTRTPEGELKYYLIETGTLREVRDVETMVALRLIANKSSEVNPPDLSEDEKVAYPIATPFPPHKDGLLIKAARHNSVFLVKDGKKHHVPDFDTFLAMNLKGSEIQIWPAHDMEQVTLGDPLPPIAAPGSSNRRRILWSEVFASSDPSLYFGNITYL